MSIRFLPIVPIPWLICLGGELQLGFKADGSRA